MTDNVEHPKHYTNGNIECIDAMVAAFGKEAVMIYCRVNAFKYIWRSDLKGHTEDIRKAAWYLRKYLEFANELENEKEQNYHE